MSTFIRWVALGSTAWTYLRSGAWAIEEAEGHQQGDKTECAGESTQVDEPKLDAVCEERFVASPTLPTFKQEGHASSTLHPQSLNNQEPQLAQQQLNLMKAATRGYVLLKHGQHLQSMNKVLLEQTSALTDQHDTALAENNRLQAERQHLISENQNVQANHSLLLQQNRKLVEQRDQALEDSSRLHAKCEHLGMENELLARACDEWKSKAHQAEALHSAAWSQRKQQFQTQQEDMAKQQHCLQHQLAEALQALASLRQDHDQVNASHAAAWAAREEEHNQQLHKLYSTICEVKDQLDAARAREHSHQGDTEIYKNKHMEQHIEILRLRHDLKVKDAQLADLMAAMTEAQQNLQTQLADTQRALASLQEDYDKIKSLVTPSTARCTLESAGFVSDTSSIRAMLSTGSMADSGNYVSNSPSPNTAIQSPTFGMLTSRVRAPSQHDCKITRQFRASQPGMCQPGIATKIAHLGIK